MMNSFFDIKQKMEDFHPIYTTIEIPSWLIKITWNDIRSMDENQFVDFCKKFRVFALDQYKKYRYPIFARPKSLRKIISGFRKYNVLDVSDVPYYMDDKFCLKGTTRNYSSGINNWFPEIYYVDTVKGKTSPMSLIENEKRLINSMKAVLYNDTLKVFAKNPDKPIFERLIKVLSIARGTQKVGHFSPDMVKWLYIHTLKNYKDKELYVYDPCGGWAGSMVPLFAASYHLSLFDKKITYIATDVNSDVHDRYEMIYQFWKTYINPRMNVFIHKFLTPAEEMHNEKIFRNLYGKGNMAFTSPPYYNKERYSKDENQSYIKYKSYSLWLDGFLTGMIKNVYDWLGDGGVFFLNVADTKNGKERYSIQDDSLSIAKSIGFNHSDTYYMVQTVIAGTNTDRQQLMESNEKNKFEPIFKLTKGVEPVIIDKDIIDIFFGGDVRV